MSIFSKITGRDARNRTTQNMNAYVKRNQAVDPYGREGLVNTENQQMSGALARGTGAMDTYENFAKNFDASKGLDTYARGAWGSISDQLNESLRNEQGSAESAGRLKTGFYDEDRGTIYNRATKQLNDSIAQQALGAQGQQIGVMQNYGQYGENQQGVGLDLLTSRREELENNAREEEARQRQKKRGVAGLLGGLVGGAGGFLVSGGNPAGAFEGYKLGSAAGSSF